MKEAYDRTFRVVVPLFLIVFTFFELFILLDTVLFNNVIFKMVSFEIGKGYYNFFGDFFILYLFIPLLLAFLLFIEMKIMDKGFIFLGYFLLSLAFNGFFSTFPVFNIYAGLLGLFFQQIFTGGGKILAFFLYFFWISVSIIFLFFPYKILFVNFIMKIYFSFSSIINKEKKVEKKKDVKSNKNNFLNDKYSNLKKTISKRKSPPFISKVIYEDYNERIEVPLFNNNEKIRKFHLNEEDNETEEYQEEDFSENEKYPNDVYRQIENISDDYYKRVKLNWPDKWKDNNHNKPNDNEPVENNQNYDVSDNKTNEFKLLSEFNNDIVDTEYEFIDEINTLESSDSGFDQHDELTDKDIERNINGINLEFDNDEYEEVDDSNDYENDIEDFPDFDILNENKIIDDTSNIKHGLDDAETLENTLKEFGIKASVVDIIHGPVVTLFKLEPAAGIKLSKIEGLSDNLALRLAAKSIRIIAPIPGERVVGIEVPNRKRQLVSFREIIDSDEFLDKDIQIPVGIGKDIYGNVTVIDLHKMPHVLIAGATGAGKSVCVNAFISSILFSKSPDDLKLLLIDPKIVELQPYNDIPHLITPVITDSDKAIVGLKYLVYEMERRYAILGNIGVRDIVEYQNFRQKNNNRISPLPYIVAFVDEFADLMSTSGKEVELLFARLTAKARAIGIHLVLATQRPSTDVITGLIKANVPARIAFQVISYQDSRIILDQKGAEKLLGQGDMLYLSPSQPFAIRLQGAFLSKEEVDMITEHWKRIREPDYIDLDEFVQDNREESDLFSDSSTKDDPLFNEALEIVIQSGKASASYLQRRLNIGYNRAARIIEEMEEKGIVGPMRGSKPREIINIPK